MKIWKGDEYKMIIGYFTAPSFVCGDFSLNLPKLVKVFLLSIYINVIHPISKSHIKKLEVSKIEWFVDLITGQVSLGRAWWYFLLPSSGLGVKQVHYSSHDRCYYGIGCQGLLVIVMKLAITCHYAVRSSKQLSLQGLPRQGCAWGEIQNIYNAVGRDFNRLSSSVTESHSY